MATINGIYIFVESEDYSYTVDVTEHTVETGVNISDHVKRKAIGLSVSGEIVGQSAALTMAMLQQMQARGTQCTYVGRNVLTKCLIKDFQTSNTNKIWGGCAFTMTLQEVRTAKTSYQEKKTVKTGTQQVQSRSKETAVYHTVKKGDTIWGLTQAPNAPYKKYGMSCNEVMKENPDAFSKNGDFRTLQVGAKIKVGTR